MSNKNIKYRSRQILQFYSCNRQKWKELYPSEKWVFKRIVREKKSLGDVLDVGCACAGLAAALSERFILNSYTGVDINEDVIDWARKKSRLTIPATFIVGDIIKKKLRMRYDTVVSLSCADWNIQTNKIIKTSWAKVKSGGYFILSLRLTPEKGINNIKKSYQYINFSKGTSEKEPEIANYVVCNFRETLKMLKGLSPSPELIGGYGYWGRPSATAVTPFQKIVFAVFYIKKALENSHQDVKTECSLPEELLDKCEYTLGRRL